MKAATILSFIASVVLATAFIASKFFAPAQDDLILRWLGEWLMPLAYIFGAAGILLGALTKQIPDSTWTIIGGAAGAFAAIFTVLQVAHDHQRSVDRATLDLFSKLEERQPPNGRFCRCAIYHLFSDEEEASREQVLKREDAQLSAQVVKWVNRCLADKPQERDRWLKDNRLAQEGVSFFATRAALVLSLDDDIAYAIRFDLVRKDIVANEMQQSIPVGKRIAERYELKYYDAFTNLRKVQVDIPDKLCVDDTGLVRKPPPK